MTINHGCWKKTDIRQHINLIEENLISPYCSLAKLVV